MLVILILIFVNGCAEKQTELTPTTNEVKNSSAYEESNSVENIEFVPEHIVNSSIEVVPH